MNLAGKDDDDGKDNSLLPTHIDRKRKTSGDRKDIAFKCYVIISMTIIWTAYTLLVRYTRSHRVGDMPLYSAPTVVLLAECTKFCISIAFILHSCRFHLRDTRDLLSKVCTSIRIQSNFFSGIFRSTMGTRKDVSTIDSLCSAK
jgi:hypothetical protein